MAVGVLAIGFGIHDVATALRRRRELGWWWALVLHGVLSVAFGLITLASIGLPRALMAALFAGWLAIAGIFALAAGLIAHGRGALGRAGLSIFVASVAANVIVLADVRLSAFVLLYAGAAYAALLGITEMGLGQWLRLRGAAAGLDVQEAV
jgi:uncharacterized membrane protein HdeD (DUF308 family)